MKKTLIALCVTSALSPVSLLANETTDESLVVTASRTPQQQFDVLAPVDVFSREDIELINPESLAGLLNRVAGVTTTTTGTAGNNTSVFVRGGNSDHVLILVDGVRIGSATLGQKNIGDVPVSMIERVEVIRGPRAALWGSDAIGGVIQIFTRKLEAGQGVIGAEIGSENLWKLNSSIGFGNEQHQYTLSAATSETDGFDVLNPDAANEIDKDGYDRQSLAVNGQSQFSDSYQVGLSAQLDKGTTEYDSAWGGNKQDFENHFIQMSNQITFDDASVTLKFANSKDSSEDNADERVTSASASTFETKRNQINVIGAMPVAQDIFVTGGLDWYKEEVESSTLYSVTERTAKAAYVVGRAQFDQLKVEASIRRDEVGDTESETTNQFAFGYQVSDNLLLSYSQGSAFKVPTFNDLFWPDSFGSIGNPNLKSEKADNKEFLARFRSDGITAEFSVYETDFENLIEWSYNPTTQYSSPQNVANAKAKGAELTLGYAFDRFSNRLSLAHVDAKNSATGTQLLRRPIFSGFYELNYQGEDFNVGFELQHQGKRNDTGGRLPGYTIANLSLAVALLENVDFRAKVNNLFDKQYVQAAAWPDSQTAAYPGAGSTYTVAVDVRF